jgi:hypothetical protein
MNRIFVILTPFISLSLKGEGEVMGFEGAKPLQPSPANNPFGGEVHNGMPD